MLGLAELYQSVRTAALNQKRQPQLVSIFTTELFAYYLRVRQTPSTDEFKRYPICISDAQQLFIGDVLLFLSLSRLLKFQHKPIALNPERSLMNANQYNSFELVEQLTTYRLLEAWDFGSVATIAETDFEAMYAYKHGDYQRCLRLSTQNVHTLWHAGYEPNVPIFPETIQLLDDDFVSLTALTLIVNPQCRHDISDSCISQLTLSLYLMTQCQLKLLHTALTSLAQTFRYIREVAEREHSADRTLDQLTLKLIERKVVVYLSTLVWGR